MYKIIDTTDGKFKGKIINDKNSIVLDNFIFTYTNIKIVNDMHIFYNSNYVIYAKKIQEVLK